jgi:outer membrane protein W
MVFAAMMLLAVVAMVPSANAAPPPDNPYELTLSGGGAFGPDLDGFNAAVTANIGYYLNENFELSLRQSIAYADTGLEGSAWNGSTRVAVDYHFPMGDRGQWVPFVGANLGYVYGQSVHDTWEAAPEAGLKYYVNSTTFIYGIVEYQFFFDQGDDASQAFSDGQFVYSFGVGFRF